MSERVQQLIATVDNLHNEPLVVNGAADRSFLLEGTANVWEASHKRAQHQCVLFSDVLVYYGNLKSKTHKLGGVVAICSDLKVTDVVDSDKDGPTEMRAVGLGGRLVGRSGEEPQFRLN